MQQQLWFEWMRAFHGSGRTLVGKTYDLKSACRQLGICSEHLHAAWICVSSPYMTEPALFQLHAMPFGATAAVTNFLRCAEALKACSATLLHFAWTSFSLLAFVDRLSHFELWTNCDRRLGVECEFCCWCLLFVLAVEVLVFCLEVSDWCFLGVFVVSSL